MKMNVEELLTTLTKKNGTCYVSKHDQHLVPILMNLTSSLSDKYTLKDRIEILRANKLDNPPVCKMCGTPVHWGLTVKKVFEFKEYCGQKCAANDPEKNKMRSEKVRQQRDTIQEKIKQTCLEKYGVEHSFLADSVKEKTRMTCLEKYGVENVLQSGSAIRETRTKTMIERYGTEHALCNEELKEKVKTTNRERYGVDWAMQNPEFKVKFEQSMNERYGVVSAMKNAELKDRFEQSMLERYGAKYTLGSEELRGRVGKTIEEKYGVAHPLQNKTLLERARETSLKNNGCEHWLQSEEGRKLFEERMMDIYGVRHALQNKDLLQKAQDAILRSHSIIGPVSKPHQAIIDWMNARDISGFTVNDRTVISDGDSRLELDLYFESEKLAIEINGLYWHSFSMLNDKYYHQRKYELCEEKGITLLQFWDFEILNKFELVASMILSKLGKTEKIPARKCKIIELNGNQTFEWYEKTHIQGGIRKRSKALEFNGEIVAAMVLVDGVMERFSSKLNTTVVGGMGKLLKAYGTQKEVLTYIDNRYSNGASYKRIGFELVKQYKEPKYYYTENYKSLIPRWAMMKDKMEKMEGFVFDKMLTEKENALNNGYDIVWGCCGSTWKKKL